MIPHGHCQMVDYPHNEELYFVLAGSGVLHYGEQSHPLAQNDFTYPPPTGRTAFPIRPTNLFGCR